MNLVVNTGRAVAEVSLEQSVLEADYRSQEQNMPTDICFRDLIDFNSDEPTSFLSRSY
ncbi:hypothetical protein [Glaciihabitans sp. UYNi722]|uniref:hypothetical protein n=1 Tax=Glaciihabitans sp. UYNi722 TaxID=3156344 RepID=UPI003394BBE4